MGEVWLLKTFINRCVKEDRGRKTMAENGKRGWVDWELYKQIRASMPLASVDILAVHEGRLLLMRRVNEPGKGVWFVPGGRIRYGETHEQTVLRELE